jgi:hypothetical protein
VSSRTDKAIQRNPVSKNQKKKKRVPDVEDPDGIFAVVGVVLLQMMEIGNGPLSPPGIG